ncbi:hypothetical protein [Adhaeribacter aquaticus]|uniref:hypothetical protein n=1 Tax=Adhaeribacter aquaticus TaxID=299567 RepID=UPI0003FF11AC|nr:hypothetical protein [Adhaeribacter aquaticus]
MNRTLAQVLSAVFHPLLVPTFLFFIIFYIIPASAITFPVESRWIILVMLFFTTCMVPGLGTYAMLRSGYIKSLQLEDRPERSMPFFFTSMCFATTTYMLYRESYFDRLLFYVMCLITISVFLTYLFSFFWKISAHSVGMGGLLSILLLLNTIIMDTSLLYTLVASIVLAGLVMAARLALDAHTPAEVYSGFALGFSTGLGMWLVIA